MTRPVVPIANLQRRLPEAGRLRTGVKIGRSMKSIATWRATSRDEDAVREIATIYGGTPRPWSDAPTPGQWEVITEASELHIVLPPDSLGGTPIYESWSAGGCQRRCDGLTCQTPTSGPDGTEMSDVPCMCAANGEMVCRPHTRLSVILPDVRFGGTWRYESATSWNVAQEIPGMVDLIQSLQERGLSRALLGIEHRKSVAAGQTRRFTIPVLRVAQSMDGLLAGAARVAALPSNGGDPSTLAIEAAPEPTPRPPDLDDEVIDAEIVDDEVPDGTCSVCMHAYGQEPLVKSDGPSRFVHKTCADPPREAAPRVDDARGAAPVDLMEKLEQSVATAKADRPTAAANRKLFACLNTVGILGDDDRHAEASKILRREVKSFTELTRADTDQLITTLEALPATKDQLEDVLAGLRDGGILGPQRFSWSGKRIGRSIKSFDDLTCGEASKILAALTEERSPDGGDAA